MSETLKVLDRRWRNACKVLFREEVGPLSDFLPYLSELVDPQPVFRSALSGREVSVAFDDYAKGSKFISFDEAVFGGRFEPLSINDIKDMDSLVEAVRERILYSGNVILGACTGLESCTNVSDCHYMYKCETLVDSKYMAFCQFGRANSDCFGTDGPGESEFCVRCSQTYREKRCFEVWNSQNCNDSYYCYGLNGASNCIFSFNQRNKRHLVGNLGLEPSKYEAIRQKLLSEIAQELAKRKRAPSLIDIIKRSRLETPEPMPDAPDIEQYAGEDQSSIEKEFSGTCRLVLGKPLSPIDGYRSWLEKHADPVMERKSAASGRRIVTVTHIIAVMDMPPERLLTIGEARLHGEKAALSEGEAGKIRLESAHELIGKIAFLSVDLRVGENRNMIDCVACIDSSNCYRTSGPVYSKYCGCMFWPRSSENCFGSHSLMDCSFCIHCYRSQKLSRCFELDTCRGCSDCHFCHNCENCRDCMFCFNAKNLSHAIGNVEYSREEYLRIKKRLLSEIAGEIEKKKGLKWSIYSIGAAGKE